MSYSDRLDPMHVANLKRLSAFLKVSVPPPGFSMDTYLTVEGESYSTLYAAVKHPEVYTMCGTVACAIGHGPIAGIEPIEGEGWVAYGYRAFVDSSDNNAWRWLFASEWYYVDNTALGAAARIDWYLEHGVPPDANSQRLGQAALCYAGTA